MVRTKADGCSRKAVAAKAPRKVLSSASPSTSFTSPGRSGGKAAKYAGGNSVCPRPTPSWQKGINSFVIVSPSGKKRNTDLENQENEEPSEAGCSTSSTSCGEGSSATQNTSTNSTSDVEEEKNTTDSEDDE